MQQTTMVKVLTGDEVVFEVPEVLSRDSVVLRGLEEADVFPIIYSSTLFRTFLRIYDEVKEGSYAPCSSSTNVSVNLPEIKSAEFLQTLRENMIDLVHIAFLLDAKHAVNVLAKVTAAVLQSMNNEEEIVAWLGLDVSSRIHGATSMNAWII